MKKVILFLFIFFQLIGKMYSNNLVMGTPTKSGSTISFTIKWNNSWKVTAAPANWDAIWVFVKRQRCDANSQTPWMHETLNSTASNHTVTGSVLQVDLANSDKLGVFIRRKEQGVGNISQETVTLTLSSDVGLDNIAVYGIEMVYVPAGQFYVGSAYSDAYQFTDGNSYNSKLITQAIQDAGIGTKTNYSRDGLGSSGPLPSTFPLGYYGYYTMKYEITCKLYCSFLNALTYTQQIYLLDNPNTAPTVASPGAKINSRYGYNIEVKSQNALEPAVYACDATDDNSWDQANDGLELPVCLRVRNLLSFLDWAALRPMTEFEYEKACRGPVTPVFGEYSWGTIDISSNYTIVNPLNTNEYSSTAPLGLSNIGGSSLYRVGIEATSTSDRIHAGATYYGILNMTGSVYERCVGGWQGDYSAFTNINGDGNISSTAVADVNGWPAPGPPNYQPNFYIPRGGSKNNWESAQVSGRRNLHDDYYDYDWAHGGRGVRSYY
jgi:formylglycine-generating enzyme required for sulfatase activity